MTNRQKVHSLAEQLGATVEISRDGGFEIHVQAPEGSHWNEGVVHEIVEFQYSGFTTEELWGDVFSRMEYGLESCNDDCDW